MGVAEPSPIELRANVSRETPGQRRPVGAIRLDRSCRRLGLAMALHPLRHRRLSRRPSSETHGCLLSVQAWSRYGAGAPTRPPASGPGDRVAKRIEIMVSVRVRAVAHRYCGDVSRGACGRSVWSDGATGLVSVRRWRAYSTDGVWVGDRVAKRIEIIAAVMIQRFTAESAGRCFT
jgi:hypothetical protein